MWKFTSCVVACNFDASPLPVFTLFWDTIPPHKHCDMEWAKLQWASYQIRKMVGCACARNAGNVFPHRWLQRKPLVSDHGMHHGTCVMHVPWCISVSLTHGCGENVPGIPGACAPAILHIWQEAHVLYEGKATHTPSHSDWVLNTFMQMLHRV